MLKKAALALGAFFVIAGVGGFIPALSPESNGVPLLFGIFAVGVLQNIIHLASGAAALIASKTDEWSRLYFQVFGVVYAIVTVVGFVQGDTVLGLFTVNLAENLLHLLITAGALTLGFGSFGSAKPRSA
ncbi:MAG: DUF4383 domain-containing protein [Candidatus Saccharimonadales bacterium]